MDLSHHRSQWRNYTILGWWSIAIIFEWIAFWAEASLGRGPAVFRQQWHPLCLATSLVILMMYILDENKVKLTYVPGAVLYENVEPQKPSAEVHYEIGEEKVDSGQEEVPQSSSMSSSYDTMLNVDPAEARQSIINTINSYEDDRYPSQGVDYSNMASNAQIEQSVASEILERTLQHEEQVFYQQVDALTSRAGNVDNKTNAIIEQISDQLENEYSLPEVSLILEAHMTAAEQRWRAGELMQYIPVSPAESSGEDEDETLVPSHDTSLEGTLTEEGANRLEAVNECNDSGIGIDKSMIEDDEEDKPARNDNVVHNTSLASITEGNENEAANDEFAENNDSKVDKGTENNDTNIDEGTENNDSKIDDFESVLDEGEAGNDKLNDTECEELFEDCDDGVGDVKPDDGKDDFDRMTENYSLEMKLALGIDKKV